jgi:hypothetical protein
VDRSLTFCGFQVAACNSIFEAAFHALVAHPVTHEIEFPIADFQFAIEAAPVTFTCKPNGERGTLFSEQPKTMIIGGGLPTGPMTARNVINRIGKW